MSWSYSFISKHLLIDWYIHLFKFIYLFICLCMFIFTMKICLVHFSFNYSRILLICLMFIFQYLISITWLNHDGCTEGCVGSIIVLEMHALIQNDLCVLFSLVFETFRLFQIFQLKVYVPHFAQFQFQKCKTPSPCSGGFALSVHGMSHD